MQNILKFFGLLFYLISVLFLIYVFYKSEIIFSGEKRYHYNKYYFLTVLFFSFSFLYNFINNKLKIYSLIFVLSSISSLYLFEYFLILKQQNSKLELKERNITKDKILKKKKIKF